MAVSVYGKVPMRGDFITRLDDTGFAERWHGWIASGLAAAEDALGPAWRAAFLKAPIWRFALGRAEGGPGQVGAMMPSIDSAGRLFPLSVLCAVSVPAPLEALVLARDWLARLEALLLAALEDGAELDDWLSMIKALGDAPGADDLPTPQQAGAFATGSAFGPVSIGLAGLAGRSMSVGASQSAWWCAGGYPGTEEDSESCLLIRSGLPAAQDWPILLGVRPAASAIISPPGRG